MDKDNALKLRNSIKRHEDLRLKVYLDSKGIPSVGWGRNLKDNGLSESECEILLSNDIANSTMELYKFLPLAQDLDDIRKSVLIEMTFTMGVERVLLFRDMINALKSNDFKRAADAMLDSEWSRTEAPSRAQDLAHAMEFGTM